MAKKNKREEKLEQYRKNFHAGDIKRSMETCKDIFATGVFQANAMHHPFFQASLVHVLICLSDLVQKADADGTRITKTDFIHVTDDVKDVTDLITKCRNAVCHISSPLQELDMNRYSFHAIAGIGGSLFNTFEMSCEFEDDIAIYYGQYRIYISRHIARTIEELALIYADVLR